MELPINYEISHWTVRKQAREQYIKEQGGKCFYCGCNLNGKPSKKVDSAKINKNLFPKNMFKYPVHLHHCRKSGLSLGAVHAKCNAYLWQYLGE